MFGVETLSGPSHAAAIVALVFGEALALYVGYGTIQSAFSRRLTGVLEGRCALAEALVGDCAEA
ncbi:MAG: hypothetical protein ABEJ31_06535 [Haloarculaceae archaeon]